MFVFLKARGSALFLFFETDSPFLMPNFGNQLLVAFAEGRLLVRAHESAALEEELGERGAGTQTEARAGEVLSSKSGDTEERPRGDARAPFKNIRSKILTKEGWTKALPDVSRDASRPIFVFPH